jgi:hypothetical protein
VSLTLLLIKRRLLAAGTCGKDRSTGYDSLLSCRTMSDKDCRLYLLWRNHDVFAREFEGV